MGFVQRCVLCAALLALVSGSPCKIPKRCKPTGCCEFCQGNSKIIECDLKKMIWIPIPKNKETSDFDRMYFSHGTNVSVDHNALDLVEDVHLTDLEVLTFLNSSNNQAGLNGAERRSAGNNMTIDGVRNLHLFQNSLNGWQSKKSNIWIKNIEYCRIDKFALTTGTTIKQLLLENITSLVLAEDAIRATVGELRLRNVTITDCPAGAFGGAFDRLQLISVTVKSVRAGCLRPQRAWHSLTLRSSPLGRVSEAGITGTIRNITVTESDIASVDTGGIQLNGTHFSLSDASIGELRPRALLVQADQAISLQRLNVSRLHGNAFRRLRVVGNPNRGINVTALTVARADAESLVFANGADVRVRKLNFDVHKNCGTGKDRYFIHTVYVESAWQPAVEICSNISSRLYTVFEPLFACDLGPALDAQLGARLLSANLSHGWARGDDERDSTSNIVNHPSLEQS